MIKKISLSSLIVLTMVSSIIFGMQEDQCPDGWDDTPYLSGDKPDQFDAVDDQASEILADQEQPQPPYQHESSFPINNEQAIPLLPSLPLPSFLEIQAAGKAPSPLFTPPIAPAQNTRLTHSQTQSPTATAHQLPMSNITPFQSDVMSSIEILLALQQKNIELSKQLSENTKQLINLNCAVLTKLLIVEANCSYNQGRPLSPIQFIAYEKFKKLFDENSRQQEAVSRAHSSSSLKELLELHQATLQQIAKVLQFDLKEKT